MIFGASVPKGLADIGGFSNRDTLKMVRKTKSDFAKWVRTSSTMYFFSVRMAVCIND